MVRVAMLNRWHVHADEYATRVNDEEQAQVVAVWDGEPERGQGWATELGVDFEADLDRLLARGDIDAVAVDAPTNMHPEVMIKAAQAGKHIFTEKVMAATVEECRAIADAVTRAASGSASPSPGAGCRRFSWPDSWSRAGTWDRSPWCVSGSPTAAPSPAGCRLTSTIPSPAAAER